MSAGIDATRNVQIPASKPVSALSIHLDGSLLALAGKAGLYISSVEKPDKITKTLNIPNVAGRSPQCTVQWNPHSAKRSIIASSNGKNLYFWDVEGRGGRSLLSTVESHSRAIQGLSWSVQNPDLLASCSNDTYINVWDTRTPRAVEKYKTFCSWTVGATDVKWNRLDGNLLASSHAGEVRVWDLRKDTTPLTFITAHNSKINSIDWSYTRTHDLLTCAQDKKIKFWTITMPRTTQATLRSSSAISDARFMPFRDCVLTRCPEEHVLKIWKASEFSTPAHVFAGHKDMIIGADFRITTPTNSTSTRCHIVSLSRDNEVFVWKVPATITSGVELSPANQELSNHPSRLRADRSYYRNSYGLDLRDELKALESVNHPGLTVFEKDAKDRFCRLKMEHKGNSVELRIIFPTMYPNAAHPNFSVISTTLSPPQRSQYLQNLNNIAQNAVQKNQGCVEKIITHTLEFLELQQPSSFSERERDEMPEIPCPCLAGASFTGDGKLLFFHNISFSREQNVPHTYEGLLKFLDRPVVVDDPVEDDNASNLQTMTPYLHSISSFYYTEDCSVPDLFYKQKAASEQEIAEADKSRQATAQKVMIVDVSNLLILNKKLAMSYRTLGDSSEELCKHNALAARAQGREDLYKTWLLLSSVTKSNLFTYNAPRTSSIKNYNMEPKPSTNRRAIATRRHASVSYGEIRVNDAFTRQSFPHQSAWSLHPFANQLIESLFTHYQKIRDVQTLAAMTCVLSQPPNILAQKQLQLVHQQQHALPYALAFTERYVTSYSNILYQWGFSDKASEVMKTATNPRKPHPGLDFGVICKHCGSYLMNEPNNCCKSCHRRSFVCALCNLPVRGMSTFCFHCGHGGHTNHMREWFSKEDVCPTGCGCRCLQNHAYIQK